jgi:hypothetical protein
MEWYTLNDPECEFCSHNGNVYGRVNGVTFVLSGNSFIETRILRNGYMPDEVTEPVIAAIRMIPHHIRYAKEAVRRVKKKIKRNGPFMPSEVSKTIKTHLSMLPHHYRYVKGAIGEMKNLAD